MAMILNQTDAAVTFQIGCSPVAAGTTNAGRAMAEGGTLGTTEFTVDPTNNTARTVICFRTTGGLNASTWAAGDFVIRLNVSTANGSNTWTAAYICERTAAGAFNTVASLTGQAVGATTTGVKTMTVNRATDFTPVAADSDLFIAIVIRNNDAHGNSKSSFIPNQQIDTPITADGGGSVTESVAFSIAASSGLTDGATALMNADYSITQITGLEDVAFADFLSSFGLAQQNTISTTGTISGGSVTEAAALTIGSVNQMIESAAATADGFFSLINQINIQDAAAAVKSANIAIVQQNTAGDSGAANASGSLSVSQQQQLESIAGALAAGTIDVSQTSSLISNSGGSQTGEIALNILNALTSGAAATIGGTVMLSQQSSQLIAAAASADAQIAINTAAAITQIAKAVASLDLSITSISGIQTNTNFVGTDVTFGNGRTIRVQMEIRTYEVAAESRTIAVEPENRTFKTTSP